MLDINRERNIEILRQASAGITAEESAEATDRSRTDPANNLPIQPVRHEYDRLPDCPACEGTMELWDGQFETSEEITVVERPTASCFIKGRCCY